MGGAQEKWDAIYSRNSGDEVHPVGALSDYAYLLPSAGVALDLACGKGGNALHLARRGLHVKAWDISTVAIEYLKQRGFAEGLTIDAQARDVVAQPPALATFDLIVVTRYLERALAPALSAALKPGGTLVYQTFVVDKVSQVGPTNPAFLLSENELLTLFSDLVVRIFSDTGSMGDVQNGTRNESLLIAQKPR